MFCNKSHIQRTRTLQNATLIFWTGLPCRAHHVHPSINPRWQQKWSLPSLFMLRCFSKSIVALSSEDTLLYLAIYYPLYVLGLSMWPSTRKRSGEQHAIIRGKTVIDKGNDVLEVGCVTIQSILGWVMFERDHRTWARFGLQVFRNDNNIAGEPDSSIIVFNEINNKSNLIQVVLTSHVAIFRSLSRWIPEATAKANVLSSLPFFTSPDGIYICRLDDTVLL